MLVLAVGVTERDRGPAEGGEVEQGTFRRCCWVEEKEVAVGVVAWLPSSLLRCSSSEYAEDDE